MNTQELCRLLPLLCALSIFDCAATEIVGEKKSLLDTIIVPAIQITHTVFSPQTVVARCSGRTPVESASNPTARWGIQGQCDLMSSSTHLLGKKYVYRRTLRVYVDIPVSAKITNVAAFMRNEPWGGAQLPPKSDTDDLGSVDNRACPMGAGDCPIAWASVGSYAVENVGGMQRVFATFQNWAGRNDRIGTLQVTYIVD